MHFFSIIRKLEKLDQLNNEKRQLVAELEQRKVENESQARELESLRQSLSKQANDSRETTSKLEVVRFHSFALI